MLKKWIKHRGYFALIWGPLLAFNFFAEYQLEKMPELEPWSDLAGVLFFIVLTIRCKKIFGSIQCTYFVFLWLVAIPFNFGLVFLHKSNDLFMIINVVVVFGIAYFAILSVTKTIPLSDKAVHHPKL